MKKSMLLLILFAIVMSCTKTVSVPKKKNTSEVMRKRSRNPSLPPTPY